jgi:hypothetical protein
MAGRTVVFLFSSYPVFGARPNTFILAHPPRSGKKRHSAAQSGREGVIDNPRPECYRRRRHSSLKTQVPAVSRFEIGSKRKGRANRPWSRHCDRRAASLSWAPAGPATVRHLTGGKAKDAATTRKPGSLPGNYSPTLRRKEFREFAAFPFRFKEGKALSFPAPFVATPRRESGRRSPVWRKQKAETGNQKQVDRNPFGVVFPKIELPSVSCLPCWR